jgi:hypothetical protein
LTTTAFSASLSHRASFNHLAFICRLL